MLLELACSSSAPLANHETLGTLAAPARRKGRPTARRGRRREHRCREQRSFARAAAGEVWPYRREGCAMERWLGENARKISKTQFACFFCWLEWSWVERLRRSYHKSQKKHELLCCRCVFLMSILHVFLKWDPTSKAKHGTKKGFPSWLTGGGNMMRNSWCNQVIHQDPTWTDMLKPIPGVQDLCKGGYSRRNAFRLSIQSFRIS